METQIDQFIEVSQWKGSREEARAHIEAANGSLDAALALLFEDGPQIIPQQSESESQPSYAYSPPPAQGPQKSLMEELNEEYTRDLVRNVAPRVVPTKTILAIKFAFPLSFLHIFDAFAAFFVPLVSKIPFVFSEPAIPELDHDSHFEKVVSPAAKHNGTDLSSPRFLRGVTYNGALEKVKSKFNYLLVVITSEIHSIPSENFIGQVLSTALVNRAEVLVWFASAQSVEGFKVANAFGAASLPFVALVAPSQKSAQSSVIVMANLMQSEGNFLDTREKRNDFDARAQRHIDDHEPNLISLRLDRERFDDDRSIRELQDHAYQQSLEKDKRRAEEAKSKKAEEDLKEAQRKAWITKTFERASALENVPQNTACARISLRLPDGKRLNLSIPGDNPVSDVYDVAYTLLNPDARSLVEDKGADIDSASLLEKYTPVYGFALISTVTRNELPIGATILKEIDAVWPSGVFMVDMD